MSLVRARGLLILCALLTASVRVSGQAVNFQLPDFETKLYAAGLDAGDAFGASLDVAGTTFVVGAPGDDDLGSEAGAAYVFERRGGDWIEVAKLVASDGASGDRFGTSVSLDGDLIVIGAPRTAAGGAVYAFRDGGGTWTEEARLVATSAQPGDAFGGAVAVNGDRVLVGAADADGSGGVDAGAAFVFSHSAAGWGQAARLEAADAGPGHGFGHAVVLQGPYLVVGAPEAQAAPGLDSGAAYVFAHGGTAWMEAAKLTSSDAAAGDAFGTSVALEGNTALVGAPGHDRPIYGPPDIGAAYVFERDAAGTWSEEHQFERSSPYGGDRLGFDVAVAADVAVLGAPFSDRFGFTDGGYVGRPTRSGDTWEPMRGADAVLPRDWRAGHEFGRRVAWDGRTLLVGTEKDDARGNDAGAIYVYDEGACALAFGPAPASPSPSIARAQQVLSADFDGVRGDDLCIASDSSISFLFNDGAGGMSPRTPPRFVPNGGPWALALGDLDGRNGADLVYTSGAGLHVLLHDGQGRFPEAPGSPFAIAGAGLALAVADFDGVHGNDIAIANPGRSGLTAVWGNVQVLFNDGAGGFSSGAASTYVTGNWPAALAVGDFDGRDGLDLAIAHDAGQDLEILLNDGTGAFGSGPGPRVPTVYRARSMAVADFDGRDGLDVIVGGSGMQLHLNDGTGRLMPVDRNLPQISAIDPTLTDLDGDLDQDLILFPGPRVLLNDGTGRLGPALGSLHNTSSWPSAGCVGDFDGRMGPDLARLELRHDGVAVFLNGRATAGVPGRNLLRLVDGSGASLLPPHACPTLDGGALGASLAFELQARAPGLEVFLFTSPGPCVFTGDEQMLPAVHDERYRLPPGCHSGTNQIINLPVLAPGLAIHGPYLTVPDPRTGGGRVFQAFTGMNAGVSVSMQAAIIDPTLGAAPHIVLTNAFQVDL